jgi:hypothetical protein
MNLPVLGVSIDFANGPAFGNPLVLDDPTSFLDEAILADTAADLVDVSNITLQVKTKRGRNRILNKFEAGAATIVLRDDNGYFSPSNTSSPYFGKLVPLRKVRVWADYQDEVTLVTTRYFIFSGYITSYDTNFVRGFEDTSTVTLQCVDGFRLFTNIAINTVPSTPAGQLSGARINALLDVADYPSSQRAIDPGDSTMQADPGTDRNLLDAIQTVEISEFGGFFFQKTGTATFYSRNTVSIEADQTPYDFSDTGTGIGYASIDFAYDDQLIVNDVVVQRAGGVAQQVQDADSINTYFIHSGQRTGILVETDTEANNQAVMLLNARKNATLRIDSMTLNLFDTNANANDRIKAGLAMEIFDLLNITKLMPGGSTVTRELFCQGVSHEITPKMWNTTIFTSEPLIQAFILDSTIQGTLDNANAVLSY